MKKPKQKYPIHHLKLAFDAIQVYLVETTEGPALYDLRRILRELNIAIAEIRFENEKK